MQQISASVDAPGIYSCYTTSYNSYGYINSSKFRFLVYDTAPLRAEIACEQPLSGQTGTALPLSLRGDLAESCTVQISDEDGVTVSYEIPDCELSEWSGDTTVYEWVPQEPGSYTAQVIMHNDCGDLESEPIGLYAAGDVTVQLDAAGGTAGAALLSVPYAGEYGELPDAKRRWYTFDGWYTAETGGTQILPETPVTNRHAHSIYAHWNPLPAGDLNADRQTDLKDAILLSRILQEDESISEQECFADTIEYADSNRDGSISIQDLSFVLDILSRVPDSE